jgi:predicted dehydrogenase
MSDIRIAVVGLGPRARSTWIPLLQSIPGFRIVALCDSMPTMHEPARALVEHNVPVYRDYQDVLARSDVDAVALTVRSPAQGAMAAEALEAGKHVHAEVPAAHSIEDCWRIVLAAERSGLVYALAEQTRYWGFVEAWRELRASGKLGHVSLVDGHYFHYLTDNKFRDPATGESVWADHPNAEPTWQQRMPPIHYLPHELSPMLKVLDDRIVQVVGMGTTPPSRAHPEVGQADVQVAMMKTAGDTVMRMAASFVQPHPEHNWHWYRIVATGGRLEWGADGTFWFPGQDAPAMADWTYERPGAPDAARGSGHGDADYYTHVAFRDAVLHAKPLELDVYRAMDTAAPAILAATSIERGSIPLDVPDFRPSPDRKSGER